MQPILISQESFTGPTIETAALKITVHWQGTVLACDTGVLMTIVPTTVVVLHQEQTTTLTIDEGSVQAHAETAGARS